MTAVPEPASSAPPPKTGRRALVGCALVSLAAVAVLALAVRTWIDHRRSAEAAALAAQEERARDEFGPALDALTAPPVAPGTVPALPGSYDIDTTIRVVHEIDLAMRDRRSLREFLDAMARQDYRGVAPDVLSARRKLLDILFRLYAKQTEVEDQEALWELSSELLLAGLSVVSVEGNASATGAGGAVSVDRDQARRLYDDFRERREAREHLLDDLRDIEEELFGAVFDYSETYYRYVDEWDRLCALRDRSYLAVQNGDWDTARAAAEGAVAAAPGEQEAHLLLALALIEGAEGGERESGRPPLARDGGPEALDRAHAILNRFIEEHPGSSAPAFLLRGVLEQKRGQADAARLDLQQAAAYYPRQAEALTAMLDPYRARAYLRKSREGAYIVELYRSTMLGAGYFSPDLQMARASFDAGDVDGGQRKVMDHFARRRSQGQWDFVLSDIEYSERLFGEHLHALFPEDAWLDLVVAPTLIGEKLKVAVRNRSQRALHNATLVLCVHFTDMHPADYQTFPAERTIPAVLPRDTTDFGEMDVTTDLFGMKKSVADVVQHRAILVTDEAVMWVDTDEFRIAEAREFRKARSQPAAAVEIREPKSDWEQRMEGVLDTATASLGRTARLRVRTGLGKDAIEVRLPGELSVLGPVFELRYGDTPFRPEENVLDGDDILLVFDGVDSLDADDARPQPVSLRMDSLDGSVVLHWIPDGGLAYKFAGVTRE